MELKRDWYSRSIYALIVAFALLAVCVRSAQGQGNAIPHLSKQGSATQLIVDGKPFLVLGGELGNSSSSSLEYMQPIWPKLESMHLNTVLVPVYWELIEPTEEKYDFSLVDGLLQEAHKHQIHIVPLWFGAWKNSMSRYVPTWVKTDQKRFPRSQDRVGKGMEILSPFNRENLNADAHAFAALMRHFREVDSADHTVIMVQVENEIGMIPDSRDRSAVANELFGQAVPVALMTYLQQHREMLAPELQTRWMAAGSKTHGNWEEVFGQDRQQTRFSWRWYFARYVNRVTELGKAEYPLPMYLNAALIRPGYQPGQYPSAGPLPHLIDIRRAGAPQIDFLSPDIYFPNFAEWCRKYTRSGNPLFVPEVLFGQASAVNALYAVGQHDAIGFSPFSIESAEEPVRGLLAGGYDVLTQLSPMILAHQGKGTMAGLLPDSAEQRVPQQVRLGGYVLNVTYQQPPPSSSQSAQPSESPTGGLVIALGQDEFLFAGTGLVVTFDADSAGDSTVGILTDDEGKFVNGKWTASRRLNGDQTHQGRHIALPSGKVTIQRVKLYRYH